MHNKDVNYNICTQNSSCIAFNIRVVARVSEAPSVIQIRGSLRHVLPEKKNDEGYKGVWTVYKSPTVQKPSQHLQWLVDRDMTTHITGGPHVGGGRGRKVCLCSSSLVLAWGQRCHCDSRVSQSRLGKQEHKQITGAQRECARKKEGKWEMEWARRLHPRMSHVYSYCLLQVANTGGNNRSVDMGVSPSLLHSWGQTWKIHRQEATHN